MIEAAEAARAEAGEAVATVRGDTATPSSCGRRFRGSRGLVRRA